MKPTSDITAFPDGSIAMGLSANCAVLPITPRRCMRHRPSARNRDGSIFTS